MTDTLNIPPHVAVVDHAIVQTMLPELCHLLNEALEHEGKPLPKDVKTRMKKVLPPWCSHSFEHSSWISTKEKNI